MTYCPPNHPQEYEFTALQGTDILNGGDFELSCGDSFEMPVSATACITVTDNDGSLSGDARRNELGDDKSWQIADIEVDGALVHGGAKIYAEEYYILHGDDGQCYYLIEIEVSGASGSDQDDFYAFLGDVPPAGVTLNVAGKSNVSGNWIDYAEMSAGMKWEFEDGKLTIEAEDMALKGYKVDDVNAASGGEVIRLKKAEGEASMLFGAESGTYDLELAYIDENDGEGSIEVWVGGVKVHEIELTQNHNGNGNDWSSISKVTIPGLTINQGDEIVLKGNRDAWEMARIDALTFCPAEAHEPPQSAPPPEGELCIDFDAFADGTVAQAGALGDLVFEGVTFQAIRAQDHDGIMDDAMLFDSSAAQATGGDHDLMVGEGNLIIISEDHDSGDPDDNAQGGTVVAHFDTASTLTQVMMVDIEEAGGMITLYGANDEVLAEIAVPVTGDMATQWVDLGTTADVVKMEITLPGSGAIGAVKFVPGEATNAAPDALDDAITTDENTPVTLDFLLNDSDPDGDTLTITEAGGVVAGETFTVQTTAGRMVNVTVGTDGIMSFDPGTDFEEMGVTDSDTFSFDYSITDANGGTDTATATVTINGLNDAPDALDDAVTTDEDTATSLALLANDSDPDGDALTVTTAGGVTAGQAFDVTTADGRTVSLTVATDGTVDFTPGADFQTMGANDSDTFSFVYDITDSNGGTDTATATVTVTGVNDAPTAVADAITTDEDTGTTLALLANDSDPENDALTVTTAGGVNAGTEFQVTTMGGRTANVTVTAAGVMTFTPDDSFQSLGDTDTDQFTFTYAITDSNGGTSSAEATVTIDGINDGPAAVNDVYTVGETSVTTFAILENDSDPENDDLMVELLTAPAEGAITLNADGTVTFDTNSQFYTLEDGQTAQVTFDYRISDGEFTSDATVTVTVVGEGVCPKPELVSQTALATLNDGTALTVTFDAPEETKGTADFKISVDLGDTANDRYNIIYIVDVSLSTATTEEIDGIKVLDAQKAALQSLTQDILAQGIPAENLTITLLPFSNTAALPEGVPNPSTNLVQTTFTAADGNLNETAINDAISGLEAELETNYLSTIFAAAQTIANLGGNQPGVHDIIYFLSDGNPWPNNSQPAPLLEQLTNQFLPTASIHGIAIGEVIDPQFVNAMDNTGGAFVVRDLDENGNDIDSLALLDEALRESTEAPGTILNGTLTVTDESGATIDSFVFNGADFDETPFGFELNVDSVAGLGLTVTETSTATLTVELDGDNDLVADETVTLAVDIQGLLPESLVV